MVKLPSAHPRARGAQWRWRPMSALWVLPPTRHPGWHRASGRGRGRRTAGGASSTATGPAWSSTAGRSAAKPRLHSTGVVRRPVRRRVRFRPREQGPDGLARAVGPGGQVSHLVARASTMWRPRPLSWRGSARRRTGMPSPGSETRHMTAVAGGQGEPYRPEHSASDHEPCPWRRRWRQLRRSGGHVVDERVQVPVIQCRPVKGLEPWPRPAWAGAASHGPGPDAGCRRCGRSPGAWASASRGLSHREAGRVRVLKPWSASVPMSRQRFCRGGGLSGLS